MDWWSTSVQLVQQRAQEAAIQAKLLAQQATAQATELAHQASAKASEVAQAAQQASVKAAEAASQASVKVKTLAHVTAEEAQNKFRQLTVADQSAANKKKEVKLPRQEELAQYGLSQELMGFLRSLTYSTFSDFPVDSLLSEASPPSSSSPSPTATTYKLSPWQERHACLALQEVQQLHDLRFVLCPRRMDEDTFWRIYFALVKRYLPEQGWEPVPPPASTSTGLPSSSSAKELKSPGKSFLGEEDDGALIDDEQLEELENDPELAAYLTEALADTNPDIESDASNVEDLDDYLNQLDEEAKAEGEGEVAGDGAKAKKV